MSVHLKFSTRAILSILLGGLLFSAVVQTRADSPPNSSVTNTPAPKRGGTLRLALPNDISSFDPALAYDTISEPFLMLVYQGLVEYDDGVKLLPCLAKDWAISEDQRTYTFHIRPGVHFSNGRVVVASDFVYTLERTLDPKLAALSESFFEEIAGATDYRAGKTPHVRGLRAPSDETLVIELAVPDPSFLYILTLPGALVVSREVVAQYGQSYGSHPVGTGPYRLTEWRRAVEMRFERNPFSTQTDRQYLDAIDVREGGDRELHLMMFERGELDIANVTADPGIPVPDFIRIQHTPRWQRLIESMSAAASFFLILNVETPPFNELKVRQAMNYAIDKDKIVRLLHGTVAPANSVLPPPVPGYNPKLNVYAYDPAKARQLLAESSHANDVSFKLWYPTDSTSPDPVAISMQNDLLQVGIHAQLDPVTFPAFLDTTERRKAAQCSISGWSQDYPDPSDFLDTMFNGNRITDEGCQNTAFYNNPKVNALLASAATCKEPERRLQLYQDAERTMITDAPVVPLYYAKVFALHQPWLHGCHLHPVLYFRFERMWLDR